MYRIHPACMWLRRLEPLCLPQLWFCKWIEFLTNELLHDCFSLFPDKVLAPQPVESPATPVEPPLMLSPTDGAVTATGEPHPPTNGPPSNGPPLPITKDDEDATSDTGSTTMIPAVANGDMKLSSDQSKNSSETASVTPPPERKQSKLSVFSKIFKPWKWKRRKKTSEKFQKTAIGEWVVPSCVLSGGTLHPEGRYTSYAWIFSALLQGGFFFFIGGWGGFHPIENFNEILHCVGSLCIWILEVHSSVFINHWNGLNCLLVLWFKLKSNFLHSKLIEPNAEMIMWSSYFLCFLYAHHSVMWLHVCFTPWGKSGCNFIRFNCHLPAAQLCELRSHVIHCGWGDKLAEFWFFAFLSENLLPSLVFAVCIN